MKYQTIHFDIIDSTNLYIKKNYKELENFTFVSASFQEQGRGRGDHIWLSNKDENLLFSLLIKDKEIINKINILSLTTAISVVKLLKYEGFNNVSIKWPNDIFINDKKVAGILLESQLPEYVVIGVGINVNQKSFDDSYHIIPTSLLLESKKEINILSFKKKVYDSLIKNIVNSKNNLDSLLDFYIHHNYLLNKEISFPFENATITGIVIGIDSDFSLIVKNGDNILKLKSGEVNIRIE